MKCKYCNRKMNLEESDYDNPYIQNEEWSCECGTDASGIGWGLSEEWEIEWHERNA
ncbi:MAG: hypothetical protein ACRDD7_17320 [Peptostreptococcaceae bacterium]